MGTHHIDLTAALKTKRQRVAEFLQQEKIGHIQKIILGTIAAAGIISIALIAPNTLQAFEKLGIIRTGRNRKRQISRSYKKLISSGFLEQDNHGFVRLTDKGQNRMFEFENMGGRLIRPIKWDRKWRVLIFDIPEKKKVLRNKIRTILTSIGFKHLQHSVWIYPYDCQDLVNLLKKDFEIGKDLIHITTENIEYDDAIKKHFNL